MASSQPGTFFEITATGAWQPVTLISDVSSLWISCKMDNTVFTNLDTPLEFHVSLFEDGTASMPVTQFHQGKTFEAGKVVCYVKAAAGTVLSVMGMA